VIGIRAETALHCFMLLDHTAELREIAKRIAREAPGAAPGRVEAYEADAFLCPNRWVAQGARSQLFFIAREEIGDRLRCDACHSEFVV
jgi:hypothetical protein